MLSSRRLTLWIGLAMLAGAVAGALVHARASPAQAADWAGGFGVVTSVFLRLIKMIIAPLVLSTLVSGIVRAGGGETLRRLGVRALGFFIAASVISLGLGLIAVAVLRPGVGFAPGTHAAAVAAATGAFDARAFVTHLVPQSLFEALAGNEILQIVVFSIFAGLALAAIGERGAPLVRASDALVELMLRITAYVMQLAPVAVFAAVAAAIVAHGPGVLVTFGRLVGGFYLGLAVLWLLLIATTAALIGARSCASFLRHVREPVLLAFATASSEAAYPATLDQLERFGVPKTIASFVLPLGYSFNLMGSMMYCAFALLFIAQAFRIPLTPLQQLGMLAFLMVTSKGVAGVPRSALVVIAAALPHFNLPEQGLVLLLGVDQFLDMGRTATNVLGNATAAVALARWEGTPGLVRAGEASALPAR